VGRFHCTATLTDLPDLGVKCYNEIDISIGIMPPVEIIVDYGDGSPVQTWNRENPRNIWSHAFTKEGIFFVSVQGIYQRQSTLDCRYNVTILKRECSSKR
jgi:hypothetical protein